MNLPHGPGLPLLLAGPILRRTEPDRVLIWLATSEETEVEAEVFNLGRGGALGDGAGRAASDSVRLGENLFVHLIAVTPHASSFATERLLAYDVEVAGAGGLAELGLTRGPGRIAYGDLPLPTFAIADGSRPLNVLHGSCRLLHGGGHDALAAADFKVASVAEEPERRPSALFLTGDQIYADEVAAPMFLHVRRLARALIGPQDERSIPGWPALGEIPLEERQDLVLAEAGFTTDKGHNHLASFGEFAAMYVCAWNPEIWPTTFPPAARDLFSERPSIPLRARARRRFALHVSNLERARLALPGVRRLLANTPTYMSFDDHDVTDDWNLTRAWREGVQNSPSGRRIVSNALAAFWAFQGWGNQPEVFDEGFKKVVARHLDDRGEETDFDSLLWEFDRWSYTAPTHPPTIALDTRTQRGYDSPRGAARLFDSAEAKRLETLAREAGHEPGCPLIVISPVPVFGFELQERRQKYLVDRVGPYEIDFEAWHSNLRGLVTFMRLLIEDLSPSFCVLLSGDVHYGVNARASFSADGRALSIVQLVSSAQKHAGPIARSALNMLGHVLSTRHERLGWEAPPNCPRPTSLADRVMFRAVNTDEWSEDGPIFLAPRDVRLLGITDQPDYRECRIYVRPSGRPAASILVGENNVGLVTLEGERVMHRLLTVDRSGVREHTADMDATAPL